MRNLTTIATAVSLAALAFMPRLNADDWNKATKVTFSGPVEIPGQVLSAGTYWFKLLGSETDRNIVQIFNQRQNHVYATLLCIPDFRLKPTGKTVITFEERASDAPPAIKAWFYPGDEYGQDFVYPKARAQELARAENTPVPSMPENMAATTKTAPKSSSETGVASMKKSEVQAEQPSGEAVVVERVFTPPPQLSAKNTAPAEQPAASLPKTGSSMPEVGLAGSILLAAGMLLRFATGKRA